MAIPHKPLGPGRALQRWTNHVAIWVVLGGVAGATQCRRRPAHVPPLGGLPRQVELQPTVIDLGCSTDGKLVRHVVGL